jgi:hypothetical protein
MSEYVCDGCQDGGLVAVVRGDDSLSDFGTLGPYELVTCSDCKGIPVTPGSFNGRTEGSEPSDAGSIPVPGANFA